MKPYISESEANEYRRLSALAASIESQLEELAVAAVKSNIPDTSKIAILDWIKRAETFRGLSYFLTPQTEWTGGDSQNPENFKLRAPHIVK
jgi:hypothetical protein